MTECSANSIGKEASTGHNYAPERPDKPGYQYQLESVFSARQIGWDAEHVGSYVIRRHTIFDCGQNGMVGYLGWVFSTIEDTHIYNIAIKREFYGYESAGIKLHAAIDVIIRQDRIHDCSLGTWLDWQAQGTRVSNNIARCGRIGDLLRHCGEPCDLGLDVQRDRPKTDLQAEVIDRPRRDDALPDSVRGQERRIRCPLHLSCRKVRVDPGVAEVGRDR